MASQVAVVISRGSHKVRSVATDSSETNEQLRQRVNAIRIVKRINTNSGKRKTNPTISGLQGELRDVDAIIADLESDPFYGETPGRRAYRAKWLAFHRRQRRQLERLLASTEKAMARRQNGIVEAAAGLQALDYLGTKAKRTSLGKRPKYNPEMFVVRWWNALGKPISEHWFPRRSEAEVFASNKVQSVPFVAIYSVIKGYFRKVAGREPKINPATAKNRFLIQILKASGGREQFTTNSEKQAKETAASWYSRGASVTIVDRKKKTQTVYGKRNPRAKGSRDALGVFHAENPGLCAKCLSPLDKQGFCSEQEGYCEGATNKAIAEFGPNFYNQLTPGEQWEYTNRHARSRKAGIAYALNKLRAKKRSKNPSVTDLSRTFQGEADGSIDRLYAADGAPTNLARAGKLVFLKVVPTATLKAGQRYPYTFRIPGAVVAIAPNEKLWITGKPPMFETKAARKGEGLDVGEVTHICYETAKAHIGNGKTYEYVHEFGEDGGKRPHLIIDHEGMPILRGGDYKIRAEGIVN